MEQLIQKMKETKVDEIRDKSQQKPQIKSVDLKRRLYQIGMHTASVSHFKSPILESITTPIKHIKHHSKLKKQNSVVFLKANMNESPKLSKTYNKDFHIRKSPKNILQHSFQIQSNQERQTQRHFYKKDKIKMGHDEEKSSQGENLFASTLMQKLKGQNSFERNNDCQLKDKVFQDSNPLQIDTFTNQYEQSTLEEYIRLIQKNVSNIDQFLYLVKKSTLRSQQRQEEDGNIYQLQIVSFQEIKEREREANFEYYTVSRKGFCQYINGKPHSFIQIEQWVEQKAIYQKIKALKFFNRFRRWKTLKMWKKTVVKHRIQMCANNLEQKLFYLNDTMRKCLFQIRQISTEMQSSIMIISKNQGNYSLESFKHCQQKTRRQTSIIIEQYSRKSRVCIKKCFESKLFDLKEGMKKNVGDQKGQGGAVTLHNPKDNAFQALGFPSRMSYEHRSKLRKQTGKFIRFSYLVDSIYLSCLSSIFNVQITTFINKLQEIQIQDSVKCKKSIEQAKNSEQQKEKMFNIILNCSYQQISERLITEIPLKECNVVENSQKSRQNFIPLYHVREISDNNSQINRRYAFRICEHWLSMKPNLDQIFDELNFLIKQGLNSLKYFERWSRHREMQKYINILEEWDDIVSDSWEICENDNLDPLAIIDNLDMSLMKIKEIIRVSEVKLNQKIRQKMVELLNVYWENMQLKIKKIQSDTLANPAQTIEMFLWYMSKNIERFNIQIPHRIELGIFSIQLTKIKNVMIQEFVRIFEGLKQRLPEIIENRTIALNQWLMNFGTKLKEQITNIDDYVKMVGILKQIEIEYVSKRQICNDLGQLYQVMQNYKMDTRKRRDFETITLKLKDQLQQSIISTEQFIERKTDVFVKQVLRYHLPNLLKQIQKIKLNVEDQRYLKLSSKKDQVIADLQKIKQHYEELKIKKERCEGYITVLKLNQNKFEELTILDRQINDRLQLWEKADEWDSFAESILRQKVKNIDIIQAVKQVEQYKNIIQKLAEGLPENQVLQNLQNRINLYSINLPLIGGFNEELSENHWNEIYQVIDEEKLNFDLKKKQFTLQQFLKSGVGSASIEITSIFERCRQQINLQRQYHELQQKWNSLIAKCRIESKFTLISNYEDIRNELNYLIQGMTIILSNPYSQSLKQFSITYQLLCQSWKSFESWISIQQKIVKMDRLCKLLDIKKLPDYSNFQNAQRIFKQLCKLFVNKNIQTGVKLNKLIIIGIDQKITEIQNNLKKVEENFTTILNQHRRVFPHFYLLNDETLLNLITQNNSKNIESVSKMLLPGLSHLQFEGERITALFTIDGQRITKNPISNNSQIQQILSQLIEIMLDGNKRMMRSVKYKTVESNIISLVNNHNLQHLLAISKVDFSHYTQISIENQQESPEALREFYKVMKKDTNQDIKGRVNIKEHSLFKYDSIILQQLIHQNILQRLIKNNIQRIDQYQWLNELRFVWEQNNDDNNLTVKKLHIALKYGGDFIGSESRVIMHSDVHFLGCLRFAEIGIFEGSRYSLVRTLNAIGYKIKAFRSTEVCHVQQLKNFLIGCHFSDFIPFIQNADILSKKCLTNLLNQTWIECFKEQLNKKASPYLKDTQNKIFPIFMGIKDKLANSDIFRGKFRMVEWSKPNEAIVRNSLKVLNVFNKQIPIIVSRVFQMIDILEEKPDLKGVSLQQFLDLELKNQAPREQILVNLLKYIKKTISTINFKAIQRYLNNMNMLPSHYIIPSQEKGTKESRIELIQQILHFKKILILTGKGSSKKQMIFKRYRQRYEIQIFYTDSLTQLQLQGTQSIPSLFQKFIDQQKSKLLYFEGSSNNLLLSIENCLIINNQMRKLFLQSSIMIVIDTQSVQKAIDHKIIGSFSIVQYQFQRQYLSQKTNQWSEANLLNNQKKTFLKLFNQIVMPTFQMFNIKDVDAIDNKIESFFTVLQTLLPVQNLLEAIVYSLIWSYRGLDEEYAKLEYLIKKYIGEQKLAEGIRVYNLVYNKVGKEGLITQNIFLNQYLLKEKDRYQDFVLTGEYYHYSHLIRKVFNLGKKSIFIEGTQNSGKTTMLQIYKRMHHANIAYLQITYKQKADLKYFKTKINSVIQLHNLGLMGPKINYQQTTIMIDDINLSNQPCSVMINEMMAYKKYKNQASEMLLNGIKFLITGRQKPQAMKKSLFTIPISYSVQGLKSIMKNLLNGYLDPQLNISHMFVQKIANSTFQICQKLQICNPDFKGMGFFVLKRILAGFSKLKIRESTSIQKEIQKYWIYSLSENLQCYNINQLIDEELKKLGLSRQAGSIYSHLISKSNEDRRQFEMVKDQKRLYNIINQKIQKYNDSDNKRYGESFQFINFDQILLKIVKMSNQLLLESDYILFGRGGIGKYSMTKLVAYLNGFHYKQPEGSLTKFITNLASDITTLSSYMVCCRIQGQEEVKNLCQFFYTDFEAQILGNRDNNKVVRIPHKQLIFNAFSQTKGTKSAFNSNINFDSYVPPKQKLPFHEVQRIRGLFRIIANVRQYSLLKLIPVNLRCNFCIDYLDQIPVEAVLQYNQKLLAIDQVVCSLRSQNVLCSIYDYSKAKLNTSLKNNDDCVRLFSSFISNLISEMQIQKQKYSKIIDLHKKLTCLYEILGDQITKIHQKLKQGKSEEGKSKIQMQNNLREKSTVFSSTERLIQIYNYLLPTYKAKQKQINAYLNDKQYLEECFAVTASYFIYLSGLSYSERRSHLSSWYQNISCLKQSTPITNFLPLFLLSEEEFNTQPVDDLCDFYENMAIIFHSVKPIIIRDICGRGKNWLQRNCSFVIISQNDKQFLEIVSENLGRPSNILIQITKQETLDQIKDSIIQSLLYLSDNTSKITIRNEQIEVNKQAKVYLILGPGISISKKSADEFTIVDFRESHLMFQKAIQHQFMMSKQKQIYSSRQDFLRKVRNLKLDCENSIGQVSQSLYEQLMPIQIDQTLNETTRLIDRIASLTDKMMGKAQNQFQKIKQKNDLIKDFSQKADKYLAKIDFSPCQSLFQTAVNVRKIIKIMSKGGYAEPSYQDFMQFIKQALNKQIIHNSTSLRLFALRQWGSQYSKQDYFVFSLLLAAECKLKSISQIEKIAKHGLSSLNKLLQLSQNVVPKNEDIKKWIIKSLVPQEQNHILIPFMNSQDNIFLPLLLLEERKVIKVLFYNCSLKNQILASKQLLVNPRINELGLEQSCESFIKKCSGDELQILLRKQQYKQMLKAIRSYGLQQKTIIYCIGEFNQFINDCDVDFYRFDFQNKQEVFVQIINIHEIQKEKELKALTLNEEQKAMNESLNFTVESEEKATKVLFLFQKLLKIHFINIKITHPFISSKDWKLFDTLIQKCDMLSKEKIKFIVDWIYRLYTKDYSSQLQNLLSQIQDQVKKIESGSEQQFWNEVELLLNRMINLHQNKDEIQKIKECQEFSLQLGVYNSLKKYLGFMHKQNISKLLLEIDNLVSISREFSHTPKLFRASRRQPNLKGRQSQRKVFRRDSQKSKQRSQNKIVNQINDDKTIQTILPGLYLQKQIQIYDDILRKINYDLEKLKIALSQEKMTQQEIVLLISINRNEIPQQWNVILLKSFDCKGFALSITVRSIITKRNEIFTYLSKFTVSGNCQIDFKNMHYPVEFLRAYFGSELSFSSQTYCLTNSLTIEQQQKGQFIKIVTLYSSGWRLSAQGYIQNLGESKLTPLNHYYIIKRANYGCNSIQLIDDGEFIMNLWVLSKKNQLGSNKLYLKADI